MCTLQRHFINQAYNYTISNSLTAIKLILCCYSADHLELVMKEVYLPLMSLHSTTQHRSSSDKLLDLMHRLVGAMQVTKGYR